MAWHVMSAADIDAVAQNIKPESELRIPPTPRHNHSSHVLLSARSGCPRGSSPKVVFKIGSQLQVIACNEKSKRRGAEVEGHQLLSKCRRDHRRPSSRRHFLRPRPRFAVAVDRLGNALCRRPDFQSRSQDALHSAGAVADGTAAL